MSGRGCLVIRWGAYGDLLFCLPLFEYLKKKHGYLHLETTPQGAEMFKYHPAFDSISSFNIFNIDPKDQSIVSAHRWAAMEQCAWDRTVNLWRSLETSCIVEEGQPFFHKPRELRRAEFENKSFHEAPWIKAGEPVPDPFDTGTFYFPESVLWYMQAWKKRNKDTFNIGIAIRGHEHAPQKRPQGIKEVARKILDKYPEARLFLVGDHLGREHQFSFGDKRTVQLCGETTYPHAMALMKMVDFAFGVESSLLVAAGMFGTPKSAICTASGVHQVTKHHKNDFSLQSHAACSPCYRAVYKTDWCLTRDTGTDSEAERLPLCNWEWSDEKIMEGVDFAYKVRRVREKVERYEGPGIGSLPELRPLLSPAAHREEQVRPGVLREICTPCGDGIREKNRRKQVEIGVGIDARGGQNP